MSAEIKPRKAPEEDPQEEQPTGLKVMLQQYEPSLAKALPKGMSADRFISIVHNQMRINPQLMTCEPLSVVGSALLSAQLGLEIGPPLGLTYLVPFWQNFKDQQGNWQKERRAQLMIGYPGYRTLAYRSRQVKGVSAQIVYEGDEFDYDYNIPGGWDVHFKPLGVPGREWTHVFTAAETVLGGVTFEPMTKAEALAHRDRYAKDWQKGAWKSNEAEMARKTTVLRACKQLPMSSELAPALIADGASPRELLPRDDLLNMLSLEAVASEEEESDDE